MPLAITRGRQRSFFRKLRYNRKYPDTPNENLFRGFKSPGTRIRSLFVKQRSPFGDKLRLSHPTLKYGTKAKRTVRYGYGCLWNISWAIRGNNLEENRFSNNFVIVIGGNHRETSISEVFKIKREDTCCSSSSLCCSVCNCCIVCDVDDTWESTSLIFIQNFVIILLTF